MQVDTPTDVTLLWLRSLMLSAVAMGTGATAHVAADGLLPSPRALLLLLLAGTLVTAPLMRRPASTLRVVMLIVLGQTAVHGALAAMAGHRAEHPSHGHDLLSELAGPEALMALMHVAASVLVGLWVAAGERALWSLVRLAARPVVAALRTLTDGAGSRVSPLPVGTARLRGAPREVVPERRAWLACRAVTRRGPPAVRAV
jgi:hypothetical protein